MLPHAFGTFSRRSTLPPAAILGTAAVSTTLVVVAASVGDEVRVLAGLYSFGVLIAFAIAQAAVIRLRFTEPDLERPFMVPVNVRIRGRPVPVAALVGIPLVSALWVGAVSTHNAARIGGPVWLALGAVLYVVARVRRGSGLLAARRGAGSRSRAGDRGGIRADPRSGQDRPDRRGDAGYRDQAGRGARGRDSRPAHDPGPARAAARRGDDRRGGAGERVADRRQAAGRGARGRDSQRRRPRARDRRGDRGEGGERSAPI